MASPAAPFRHSHRVTYAECTVGDHVYHSRYLDLLEAARGEFLRAAGQPVRGLQEAGFIFPVIEARLRYLRPARYDDRLVIEVQPRRVAGVRLEVSHRILRDDGAVLLEAETLHVCTGLDEKPRRLPPALVAALEAWLPAAPA
ncbi:MAG: acyl-CoA thioesterase [Limisphaerales bacterium]